MSDSLTLLTPPSGSVQITTDKAVVLDKHQQHSVFSHLLALHPAWVTRDDVHDPWCVNVRERGHE